MPQNIRTPAKDQRLRRGMTLRDLAQRCAAKGVPVDHGQLGRIERREATPRPKLRAALAEILDLDINDLEALRDQPSAVSEAPAAVDVPGVRDEERAVPVDLPGVRDSETVKRAG